MTSKTVGLSGVQRSILNRLAHGWYLASGPDGTPWYYDEHDEQRGRESASVVQRLRLRGLITGRGTLTATGRAVIGQETP